MNRPWLQVWSTGTLLLILATQSFGGDKPELLVTKVVEDDASAPGVQIFRMLAEDDTSVYELACERKHGTSSPNVDKRLFKGLPKQYQPDDTTCGPFTVRQKYPVIFHEASPKHEHMAGRMVTLMEVGPNKDDRVTRMVEFKIEKVESK